MPSVETIDFHVTSECSQSCAYCWGPQGIDAVDTGTALAIVDRIAAVGARRIVFTGGDPLQRPDLGTLVRRAAGDGLEVAISTTGDLLTAEFLTAHGTEIHLVSLPLDGPSEEVSELTKEVGHFDAVMRALHLLSKHPPIDVKVATPVTRHNLDHVESIAELLADKAATMPNRLFFNVFQAFPRSMAGDVAWDEIVVTAREFAALERRVTQAGHPFRINWLDHDTLDRLYVMVFPDGSLTIPVGPSFRFYGQFLDVGDLDAVLEQAQFDAEKHRRHAAGWGRN